MQKPNQRPDVQLLPKDWLAVAGRELSVRGLHREPATVEKLAKQLQRLFPAVEGEVGSADASQPAARPIQRDEFDRTLRELGT